VNNGHLLITSIKYQTVTRYSTGHNSSHYAHNILQTSLQKNRHTLAF